MADPTHFRRTLRVDIPSLLVSAALVLAACDSDPVEVDVDLRELGVVVTSTDISLTIFDAEDPTVTRAVGLGPDGSPVTLATRGALAAVPLGIVPAVAIVDLIDGSLLRTVALPAGSGATGVAFVSDSIVLVANSSLNTVTPVNVLTGVAGTEIEVGIYPQAVIVAEGRAYVLNANLVNFAVAGPSSLTVLDGQTLDVVDEIALSGDNATAAALGPDGLLYVIQSGTWGQSDGSLSVVDLTTASEINHDGGFGNFPGSIAVDGQSLVYVGVFGVGMLVWDALTDSFVRGEANAVEPNGVASTSGIGFDAEGRLYALTPDCQDPASAQRLDADFNVDVSIPVGICPIAISFARVEGGS